MSNRVERYSVVTVQEYPNQVLYADGSHPSGYTVHLCSLIRWLATRGSNEYDEKVWKGNSSHNVDNPYEEPKKVGFLYRDPKEKEDG